MNIGFDNLVEKSKLLIKYIGIPITGVLLCTALQTDYNVKNIDEIKSEQYKLFNNDNLKSINEKLSNIKEDVILITLDGNRGLDHPTNVKSIIDTKLKTNKMEEHIASIYIPNTKILNPRSDLKEIIKTNNLKFDEKISDKDKYLKIKEILSHEMNVNDSINNIVENVDKSKNIIINISAGNDLKLDNKYTLNLESLNFNDIKKHIETSKNEANELVNILNKNDNLNVVIAAGNNQSYTNKAYDLNYTLHNELMKYMSKFSNSDFNKMQEISTNMNTIIKNKIDNPNVDVKTDFIDELRTQHKDVNIDMFVSLYIKDYLVHYDVLSILEKSKDLKNDNLKIVEAYDYETFKNNYNTYKKYNGENEELNKYFDNISYLKINDINGLSIDEASEIKKEYLEYKDKYPEVFQISKFGTFSNLEYQNTGLIEIAADGYNTGHFTKSTGTSFSAPNISAEIGMNIYEQKHGLDLSLERSF